VEGTLIDWDSIQVEVGNVWVYLERNIDENSFVQVPRETSSLKQPQEPSTQPSEHQDTSDQATTLGQQEESEHPKILEELAQPQQIMSNPQVLQATVNEERNPKRDRDEATTSSRPTDQTFAKRKRLNPYAEEEFIEETTGNTVAERIESRQTIPTGGTPSTSHMQVLERQQSIEVSSFRASSEQSLDIKGKYKEIKARNETLKAQTYAHYLKMAPTN